MPASKHTPNMNLPLYNSGDHFSVLGDMNNAMTTIDTTVGSIKTSVANAERDSTSALRLANSANDAVSRMSEGDKGALAIATKAQQTADRASSKVDGLEGRVGRAESTANSASNVASTAQQQAQSAESAVSSIRNTAEQAQRLASGLDSRIDTAQQNASSAKNESVKANRRFDLRKTNINKSNLGTSYSQGIKTSTLASVRVMLNEGDTVMIATQTRVARCAGVIGTQAFVSTPSGSTVSLNDGYCQDIATTISTISSYTASSSGQHTFTLYGGPITSGANVNWENGPQVIAVF